MTTTPRPKPGPAELFTDPRDDEFWEGVRRGELLVFQCGACEACYWPATSCLDDCPMDGMRWVPASGKGVLHTFTVYYRALNPGWKDDVPYNVAVVELDEGPFMFSNVVGVENDALEVGMRLEAVFNEVRPGVILPQFAPAAA